MADGNDSRGLWGLTFRQQLASLALLVGAFAYVAHSELAGSPLGRQQMDALQVEAGAIGLPEGARALGCDARYGPNKAIVSCRYAADLALHVLESHYDKVMSQRGWRRSSAAGEERFRSYDRESEQASLTWGATGDAGYSLTLSWRP